MKKVIFYNSNQAWGGGEKWHFNMAMELKSLGHQSVLITNPNSEIHKRSDNKSLDVIPITTTNLSFINPFKLFKLYRIFKNLKPDAIFLNLPSDVKVCAPIAKLAGVKKVIYRRGMPNPIRNTIINNFIYSKVDIIIANSNEIKKTVTMNMPHLEKKITIVYNGIHPVHFKPKTISPTFRLGNLGRLVEQKGQKHLIDIAKYLKEKQFPFTLSIAGKGQLEDELQDLIIKKNLQNEVKLIGHVEASDFFNSLDAFIFTSHFEGSANALIESLQYGIPPLAFDISSNPEVIVNGLNGYLIPPFDIKEMANRIINLCKNQETYNSMQVEGQKLINAKFLYSEKVKQVLELIND